MDNTPLMRRMKPLGDLLRDFNDLLELQWPLFDFLGDGLPIDVLHGDERLAVVLIDLVDGGDIGMTQLGRCFGSKSSLRSASEQRSRDAHIK